MPIFPVEDVNPVLMILPYLLIVLLLLFGQRMQMMFWLKEIESSLNKLKFMRDKARRIAINTIKNFGREEEEISAKVDSFISYQFIEPVSLDPTGIVWKLDHLLNVREMRFKNEVKAMAPNASSSQLNNLENLLEATLDLNQIYKIVRHFYLFSKKTKSYFIVAQLQMIMPILMQIAEAYMGAIYAFRNGQPIGDGAGPLLAAKLMRGKARRKLENEEMVVAEVDIDNRKVYVLKAEGPGGNVGKPGDAIRTLIEENGGNISHIIMVDAALKFEGEETGEVIEGIGAAIGGVGTEKFKIEEELLKYRIPISAVLIRQSIQEAISPMKREIVDGVDRAIEVVKRLIREKTKEGDKVIVAGIGNTIGIM